MAMAMSLVEREQNGGGIETRQEKAERQQEQGRMQGGKP